MNPVTVVGALIIVATAPVSLLADVELGVLSLQATVPSVIGVGLVSYGWFRADSVVGSKRWTVLKWTGTELFTFTVLGA